MISIYALIDPVTKEIRYVGKSINADRRYKQHLGEREGCHNAHKHGWISHLAKQGLRPEMAILEECQDSEWEEKERYWISYGIDSGWPLTNIQDGGIMPPGSLGGFVGARKIIADVIQDDEMAEKIPEEELKPILSKISLDSFDFFMQIVRGTDTKEGDDKMRNSARDIVRSALGIKSFTVGDYGG